MILGAAELTDSWVYRHRSPEAEKLLKLHLWVCFSADPKYVESAFSPWDYSHTFYRMYHKSSVAAVHLLCVQTWTIWWQ